jgi:hypothetical protein
MTGRTNAKLLRKSQARRCGVVIGGAASVFVAAAAMATGSAAPARADFEELIEPIIQPLMTSFTDVVSAFDPAAALDVTSWADTMLSGLGSLDLALPSVEHAAAAATSATDLASAASSTGEAATATGGTLPITIAEGTEPTITSTVDGASTTLLVDTGSSGLVIPDTDLGITSPLHALETLGFPTHIGESGYSGGVDYIYYTYDEPVDYTTTSGSVIDTTVPVQVEVYSWEPGNFASLFSNNAFQNFDASNDVTGILGIGNSVSGGAGESPLEAAGYQGVTVDLPAKELTLSTTPDTSGIPLTSSGSTVSGLTETVTNSSGGTVGSGTVSDDLDSGGVYGTIPSSISSSTLANGDVVTVSDGNTVLYSYTIDNDAPTVTSGSSIDSGVLPFEQYPISIDYSNGDLYLDK